MEELIAIMKEINPEPDYQNSKCLVSSGMFDSMCVIELLEQIEEQFGVEISPEWLTSEHFDSVENIWNTIQSNR